MTVRLLVGLVAVATAACGSPVAGDAPAPPAIAPRLVCEIVPSVATDDFERTSIGPAWAWQPVRTAAPVIRDGQLGTADPNLLILWWTADAFGADQFSEVVVARDLDSSNLRGVQAFVRRQSSGTPWRYGFHYNTGERYGPPGFEIKYDGGSPGVVLATTPGRQFRAGDVIRLEARGTRLTAFLNGSPVLSVEHSALRGGAPGMVLNPENTAPALLRAVDAWTGGDLP
jgi:hypothetical protein